MPPTLHDKMDAVSMEVPIGSGCRYAAADYWNTIDTIYSIKGGVKQYPVLLSVDGESIVLVNGISELGVELEEGQEIIIKPNSTFADYDLVECNFTDIATNLAQFGKYSFIASSFYKDNIIKTCAYSTRTIQLKASGTLLNHIGTDSIDNVYSLKLSGDLNGTDILTIRKMPNLYMLDLRDANIVNGGMSYYQNYTTSENKIGEYFFTEIKNLKKIILPNTVTSIDNGAFIYCNSLTSVIIPNTVTSIGKYVFYGCGLVSVNIPNSVTSIGHSAFSFCTSLATVIIGKSVTTIENGTFSGCSNLRTIIFPNSLTLIGRDVFKKCSGLTSVTIPNSVTSIGQSAFEGCDGLKSVTIPNSVTSIDDSAFKGCSSLTSATIGNSVTSIGKDAFRDCISLTSVTIGNSVTSIGSSAFYGCSSLKSVTIPNSVISIGSYSFLCCSGLTTVIIGNNVTTIGEWAFFYCDGLESVTSLNTTPPVINYSAFGETTEKNGTLYVPKGSKTIYWLHPYWENFKNIVEIDASDVDKVIVDTPDQDTSVYNLQGVKMSAKASDLESLPKGIYIVNGKKFTVK